MEARHPNSELNQPLAGGAALTDSQKAWHVFALLLATKRPASPAEIASICTLYHATPDLIEYLCSIPNSPLHLTPDSLVTFSSVVYLTFAKFIAYVNVIAAVSPGLNFEDRTLMEAVGGELWTKRRTRWRSDGLPVLKTRRTSNSCCDVKIQREDHVVMTLPFEMLDACAKEYFQVQDDNYSGMMTNDIWGPLYFTSNYRELGGGAFNTPCTFYENNEASRYGFESAQHNDEPMLDAMQNRNEADAAHMTVAKADLMFDDVIFSHIHERVEKEDTHSSPNLNPLPLTGILENKIESVEVEAYDNIKSRVNSDTTSCFLALQTPAEVLEPFSCTVSKIKGNDPIPDNPSNREKSAEELHKVNVAIRGDNMLNYLSEKEAEVPQVSDDMLEHVPSLVEMQIEKCSPSSDNVHEDPLITSDKTVCKPLDNSAHLRHQEKDRISRGIKPISAKKKLTYNHDKLLDNTKKNENLTEKIEGVNSTTSKEPIEQKELPNFESFVVEEEEGSGGYGTVYRARRKSDGKKFAIKYPHSNANRQNILNEVKMLERLGGKNFVITYEGSFKDGNSDCVVLEHVEHDRPDVLKKEIGVSQLQWYAYCLFKALASLHKQGIVHRDVKPGNFLFTRKLNKGYLIDFNLALDMNKKYGSADKTNLGPCTGLEGTHSGLSKSLLSNKSRKEAANQETTSKGIKKTTLQLKNTKRKDALENGRSIIKSQGADGSGITSAKEATSIRNPSREALQCQPLPSKGRRQLINLVEAMQSANHHKEELKGPTSKRKRIAAPPGKEDRHQFIYITPMPLRSSGVAIQGAGFLKGDGKQKRDGSCVGTKGFRAPEVLFRSLHQGTKLDIWSAGVSLLYLMTGRSPFAGDPDQNIREVAKLKGSEDLWEVAKLHNRESSFPQDLFDAKYLPSVKLQDWCKRNTRRADFFDAIPTSLFDLVDKCLTVNPRLRISAEDALRHDFLAPFNEMARKHKLSRQGSSHTSPHMLPSGPGQTQARGLVAL
ncbi:unnamed protein product [Cuscuta epithymum]|uniref:non-specific serine/threonine protein kinase n=1 Tax=Cuscuta epithymum TaxID=186058 RepID=A0AAV0CPF5_9ASTE|nr:unnamed protein product [Cuscuta epithymum]CAH9134166.1 unnamed protein product [Cuscuta epithymum]